MRTVYLDPDFRRTPKTKKHCCVCSKEIKIKSPKQIFVIESGFIGVHPDDIKLVDPDSEVCGWLYIGNDCAKKIGEEYCK